MSNPTIEVGGAELDAERVLSLLDDLPDGNVDSEDVASNGALIICGDGWDDEEVLITHCEHGLLGNHVERSDLREDAEDALGNRFDCRDEIVDCFGDYGSLESLEEVDRFGMEGGAELTVVSYSYGSAEPDKCGVHVDTGVDETYAYWPVSAEGLAKALVEANGSSLEEAAELFDDLE